jgi:hypothetical protein
MLADNNNEKISIQVVIIRASKVLDSSQIYRQAIYNVVELENHIFFCQEL